MVRARLTNQIHTLEMGTAMRACQGLNGACQYTQSLIIFIAPFIEY